jgi:hypothetical protein
MTLEELKKRSVKRLIVMSLSTILPIVIVIVLGVGQYSFSNDSVFKDFAGLPYMLCVLFLAWLVYKIVDYILVLKNDDYANKKLIKRNDERNKFIKLKSGALSGKIFIYVMGLACILTAFFSKIVFYTCVSSFGIFILIELIVNLVYYNKY